MDGDTRAVTIIIPTRGLVVREEMLLHAIRSVLEQEEVRAVPLVVLNGNQFASNVEKKLRQMSGVRLIVLAQSGLPSALIAGREAIDTPYFGALDDDDVLMPRALATRIERLEQNQGTDVIVTNGFTRRNGTDTLNVPPENDVAANPLKAFRRKNWLLPGSWLARTDRIHSSLFAGMPAYRECTFLAMRFSTEYAMVWLQEPTVIYNAGSPLALSKSDEYIEGQAEAVRSLLALSLPLQTRLRVRWEIAGALHHAADNAWRNGLLMNAWKLHLRSLVAWCGLRFLPFTRHLVVASMMRRKTANLARESQ